MSAQRELEPRDGGYDPGQDPDADPEMLLEETGTQPDQAEGEDDPAETGTD